MRRAVRYGCLWLPLGLLLSALALLIFLLFQAQRTPDGRPEYVALGSSFAAGAGLGRLQGDSPWLCARSINGYPQQLAHMRQLSIVDMSCGGAKAEHLLRGGQFFQRPQIAPIGAGTRLVTITVGGNDSLYIADLSQLAARNSGSLWGTLVRLFWAGPQSLPDRNFPKLGRELIQLVRAVHARAPQATIVLATYPAILPAAGTCPELGMTDAEADSMRQVANRLAAVTGSAARQGGAILVDMNRVGAAHHACSQDPWTYGWKNAGIAPFHPTLAGARATAEAISKVLDHQQL